MNNRKFAINDIFFLKLLGSQFVYLINSKLFMRLFLVIFSVTFNLVLLAQSPDVVYRIPILDQAYHSYFEGDFEKAEEGFNTCIEQGKIERDSNLIINGWIGLSEIAFSKGKTITAIKLIEEGLDFSASVHNPENKIDQSLLHQNIGYFYAALGEWEEGFLHYKEGFNYCKSNHPIDDMRTARAYFSIGTYYFEVGNIANASEYVDSALQVTKKINHTDLESYCHNFLGNANKLIGQFHDAINHQRQFLRYVKGKQSKARANNSIGTSFFELKEYQKSLKFSKLALDEQIELHGFQHLFTLDSYHNYLSSLLALNETEGVEEKINKGLYYSDDFSILHNQLFLSLLLELKIEQKKYEEGIQLVKHRIDKKDTLSPENLLIYASLLIQKEDFLEAENIIEKALFSKFNKKEFAKVGEMEITILSLKFLQKSFELYLEIFEKSKNRNFLKKAVETAVFVDTYIDLIRAQMSERNQQEYMSEYIRPFYEKAILGSFAKYEIEKTEQNANLVLFFIEKSKSLTLLEQILDQQFFDQIGQKVPQLKELDNKKKSLQYINLKISEIDGDPANKESLILRRENLYEEIEYLNEEIRKIFPNITDSRLTVHKQSIDEIRTQILEKEETYLNYSVLTNETILFKLSKDEIEINKIPISKKKLSQLINETRAAISSIDMSVMEEIKELSKLIFQPYLPQSSSLLISRDGPLYGLVFELFTTKDYKGNRWRNIPFAIKDYTIKYCYSIKTHAMNKNIALQPKQQWFGAAPYFLNKNEQANGFLNLVNSKNAIDIMADVPNSTTCIGEKCTKKSFLEKAETSNIIHLSTHSTYDSLQPSLSKLLFYGVNKKDSTAKDLLMSEIYNLNWQKDLLILPTCNSGYGKDIDGEGVASIGRGFYLSGCKNLILGQWPMNDHTTTSIMQNTYKKVKEGTSFGNALRNSQLDYLLSSSQINGHPYYWAGWAYFGSTVRFEAEKNPKWGLVASIIILLLIILWKREFFRKLFC